MVEAEQAELPAPLQVPQRQQVAPPLKRLPYPDVLKRVLKRVLQHVLKRWRPAGLVLVAGDFNAHSKNEVDGDTAPPLGSRLIATSTAMAVHCLVCVQPRACVRLRSSS